MKAVVVYPFKDKESGEIRYVDDHLELSEERFGELRRAGFVSLDASEQEEPEGEADPGKPEEPTKAEDDPGNKTAAELRAEIEAKGGFAPKRATKAQLADILGTL